MNIFLPLRTFSAYKVLLGTIFLFSTFFFPLSFVIFTFVVIVGRTHAFGAWISMWRAKKLNWLYVIAVLLISLVVGYWGMLVVSLNVLRFVTFLLFTFHFFFDEFDLQEQKRDLFAAISAIPPFVILVMYLTTDYLHILFSFKNFAVVAGLLLFAEFIFVRSISWFFVDMKIILAFILVSIYVGFEAPLVSLVFLMFHYMFWFIYPVYKLHTYKREERDGLIFILLLITFPIIYTTVNGEFGLNMGDEFIRRTFLIGTIVHILSTAPFGYLIGLPNITKYAKAV